MPVGEVNLVALFQLALSGVRSDPRVSESQGAGGHERAGLVEIQRNGEGGASL